MRAIGVGLFLLSLTACGDDAPTPAPAPAPMVATTATTPGAAPAPAPTTAPTRAPTTTPPEHARLSDADRAALRTAIADGRRLSRAGDHAAALARFETALALSPSSGRSRCEAGYVAFEAGALDRADELVRTARLALPDDESMRGELRVPTAMCLYNMGLVHEARGRSSAARAAWERSLELRPNETVRSRLAALGDPPPLSASDPPPGVATLASAASFEEAARFLRDELCREGGSGFTPDELESCDQIVLTVSPIAGSVAGGIEAAIVEGNFMVPAGGGQLYLGLVVRGAGSIIAARVGEGYSPGWLGMSAELDGTGAFEDALPGGTPELVFRATATGGDSDMGTCDYTYATDAVAVVCSTDGGALVCTWIPTASYWASEHEPCADPWGDEEGTELDEASQDAGGHRGALRFDGGRVILDHDETWPEPDPGYVTEPIDLRELLDDTEARFPASFSAISATAG